MRKPKRLSKWLIMPVVLVSMLSALVGGFTKASFSDTETSNNSTAGAWASTAWAQTSQSDFNAGISTNVSANLSAGNVLLSAGIGFSANMTVFWDGGSAPSGWTIVSSSGQPFYQRFPRGEATYGGTGGAATNTHTATFGTTSSGSDSVNIRNGSLNAASAAHTHTINLGLSTISTESNLPVYRNLKVIRYDSGVPATIPAGAIAIFDTTPPSGWTQYSAQDNKFVRGEATAAGTGGSDNHSHTVSVTTNTPTGTTTPRNGGSKVFATSTHTHTQTDTTNAVSNQPPYITVILAKADADTAIPLGMIAMFDASPTGGWNILSDSSGPFYQNYLLASSSYGATGGSASHNHDDQTVTLSTVTGTGSNGNSGNGVLHANGTHTHTVPVTSFSTVSNLPPYINVVFAQAIYSSGTIASQVFDTTVTGSQWDGLAWDETLPSGTDITFEVRASDTSFTAGSTSLPWTAAGGTSPVIASLPSGRYKQWRATLTPDGAKTNTPTLHEVRTYYYGG